MLQIRNAGDRHFDTPFIIPFSSQEEDTYTSQPSVTFLSSQTMTAISIAGKPSDQGNLIVKYNGRIRRLESASTPLTLEIPFEIRPCHEGFHSVDRMVVSSVTSIVLSSCTIVLDAIRSHRVPFFYFRMTATF